MFGDRIFRLKILMRLIAVGMGLGFGLSHLLFPTRYFRLLGQAGFDAGEPFQLFLANMVGVVVLALCVGLWIAAGDPVKHRVVVIQFLVGGVLFVPVFFYHLITGALGGWEWVNLLLVGAATYGVWTLYPWKSSRM